MVTILTEIEHLLDTLEYDDVLLCGDLNWEMSRQTGFSIMIHQFMNRIGLASIWVSNPIDYTHIHTDEKSVTTLDHFICNERLISLVKDCGPLHLGDNLSRHSPIMIKLDLGKLPNRQKTDTIKPRRPAWYKASQKEILNYRNKLQTSLENIELPESTY